LLYNGAYDEKEEDIIRLVRTKRYFYKS